MAVELYRDPQHVCLMFTDLVEEDGQAVQANQFLVSTTARAPSSTRWQPGVSRAVCQHGAAFPAAAAVVSDCLACRPGHHRLAGPLDDQHPRQLVISRIWERFAPHFTKVGKTENRVIGVPEGGRLPLGRSTLWLLPAHFLHAEGNFHFYDPVSRFCSPGDLGASMTSGTQASQPVTDLARICPHGRLSPPLHGVQQDPAPVDRHGPPAGHGHAGAPAWRAHQGAQAIADFYAGWTAWPAAST
jgi:hypothetical protein